MMSQRIPPISSCLFSLFAALAVTSLLSTPTTAEVRERIEVAPGIYMQSVSELSSARMAQRAETRTAPPPSARIVGGTATQINQWPWQVAIAFRPSVVSGSGFERQFCGGSLVTPIFVVTAAHCMYRDGGFTSPELYSAITGRTALSSNAGQEIDFDTYFVPVDEGGSPLFNPNEFDYDFVIVRLRAPSASSPIRIAGPDERAIWAAGQAAFITGWGDTAEGASVFPDALRVGHVAIVDDLVCADRYAAAGAAVRPDTMVCAGRDGGGVDTCQGDSGGPLVVPISGGGFRLIGDTSFGIGCARPEFPGVYGRLADDPARSTIGNFILSSTGINVIGSGAIPPASPRTIITNGPRRITNKTRARFGFMGSDTNSTFVCKLDRRTERPCSSPFSIRVAPGKHKMRITAVSPAGDRGPPAGRRWTVIERRR